MTADEKIKILRSYEWIIKEIALIQIDIDNLRRDAESISSPSMSGMPKASGGVNDLSNYIAKLDKLESYQVEKLNEKLRIRDRIIRAVDAVSDERERLVLAQRYIYLNSWEDIADSMSYSERQIFRLRGDAIAHIDL